MNDLNTSYHSYPRLFSIGHGAIHSIFDDPIIVEEKVDGSQISFGVFNGELKMRSKAAQLVIDNPEKMFGPAVEVVKNIKDALIDGWTYRGEYLRAPKHNTLAYDRIPNNHIILFDINTGHEQYLNHPSKANWAKVLGLEVIPLLFEGKVENYEMFKELLKTVSILGGQKIEGVAVKNYLRFGLDGHCLMGKYVSEEFKEVHQGEWKKTAPGQKDIIEQLVFKYRTPARWAKAVQHLKEAGRLDNSPKDIGALLKEVGIDLHAECKEEITNHLFNWAWEKVQRGVTGGLAQWYKDELAKSAFSSVPDEVKIQVAKAAETYKEGLDYLADR